MADENENINSFIKEILETSILDARVWMKACKAGIPGQMWDAFLNRPITAETVQGLASGISLQISRSVRQMPKDLGQEKLTEGHRFLREIYQKARNHGVDVDVKKIDWIMLPGLERVEEILARANL